MEAVHLPGAEFVRRWALHILSKGYTKSRRYGGYGNYHCRRYLAACRELLALSEAPVDNESTDSPDAATEHRCPHCESLMHCVAASNYPGWSVVMRSPFRPHWYDDG
jgi:hypothetical protein